MGEYCLCHIHVHSAARIISIKSMILGVLKFAWLLFQLLYLSERKEGVEHRTIVKAYHYLLRYYENVHVTSIELFVAVILVVVSLLLFYGNRQHRPGFYYPFIIYAFLEALQAIGNSAMFILSTVNVATGGVVHDDPPKEEEKQKFMIYCIVITTVVIILYVIRTYIFLIVIIQAQRFLIATQKHDPDFSRLSAPNTLALKPIVPDSSKALTASTPPA